MSGLKRRLIRGRAATDDEGTPQEASAGSEPVDATPDAQQGGSGVPANGAVPTTDDEPPTKVLVTRDEGDQATSETAVAGDAKVEEADRDLPAGVDPAELAAVPSSARRGRLRHRLRYLRGVRELLLRDIGGFYFEAQRAEGGVEGHQRLLDAKTARLTKLDEEMRDLEARLEEPRGETVLRVPGVGGSCPVCGEVHGSDARYCSRCGTALGRRPGTTTTSTAAPAPQTGEGKQTTASLWGRPKRPEISGPDEATMADKPAAGDDPVADKPAAADAPAADKADEPAADKPAGDEDRAGAGSERT